MRSEWPLASVQSERDGRRIRRYGFCMPDESLHTHLSQSDTQQPATPTTPRLNLPRQLSLRYCTGSYTFLPLQSSPETRLFVTPSQSTNGNLIDSPTLLHYMDATALQHINTSCDSELLLTIFADNLQQTGKFRINEEDIFTAIGGSMKQCRGTYACVAMISGFRIIDFR